MLKVDVLKTNVPGLTDEQYASIEKLSENDENAVIASHTKNIWDKVDADIEEVTGMKKERSVRSFDFLKTTLSDFSKKASNASALEATNKNLLAEKAKLEKRIEDGSGDEALKTKVSTLEKTILDNKDTIKGLRDAATTNEEAHKKALEVEAGKNVKLRLNTAFAKAMVGKKFKALPQEAIDAMVLTAEQKVLDFGTPEFREDESGKDYIVFRGEDDLIIKDKSNGLEPHTAESVYLSALAPILESNEKRAGGGGAGGGGGGGATFKVTATTRTEADTEVRNHLRAQGVAAGSSEFQDQYDQIYADSNIADLPMS